MSSWTAATFKADARMSGVFGSVTDALVNAAITEAEGETNEAAFGSQTRADTAVMYLIAHLLTFWSQEATAGSAGASGGFAPGVIQSESAHASVSYAVPMEFSFDDLGATSWGRRYLSMLKTTFPDHTT